MQISKALMNNGKPGLQVDGIVLNDIEIDGVLHPTHAVIVYIEEGVEYPNPEQSTASFEEWIRTHAASAIRCKDDRIARRPNIWPDETQYTDVYRVWHINDIQISIWTSPAPKPPFGP